ncbi:hypothetical protein ACFE04_006931 [Oxalis oulophora]
MQCLWTRTQILPHLHQVLQLCARNIDPIKGKASHAKIIQMGLQQDTLTSNMLINMYSKCNLIVSARQVFDQMCERTLVSWNTMISAYTQNGNEQEALTLFVHMRKQENSYSEFTVSAIVCACAVKRDVLKCKQLHAFAIKVSVDSNMFVGNALLDVYAKCDLVKDSCQIFECMLERNDVSWSSMIAGYVLNEHYEEALRLFHKAQLMGLEHSQFTLSSIVCAVAGLGALIKGKLVHAILCKTGFGTNYFAATSLIDMYAKCGSIRDAYSVFSGMMGLKNVALWNAMISGFAKHAHSMEVMILLEKMQQAGIQPNEITYVSVLSVCGHMGLVEDGEKYFKLMVTEHNVVPNELHYSCMVDILGRAGLINEAYDLIKKMPVETTASMWGSILASCRNHANIKFPEIAAKHLFEMEPDNAGNHILLSNIYAANKNWEEVAKVRKLLKDSVVKKEKGKSWIEIKDKVHSFMVGEGQHPRTAEIYSKLDDLIQEMKDKHGYEAEIEHDLHDVEKSRKQELLRHHSEKLAFTFGLICLPLGAPITVMKNLRICGDWSSGDCRTMLDQLTNALHTLVYLVQNSLKQPEAEKLAMQMHPKDA